MWNLHICLDGAALKGTFFSTLYNKISSIIMDNSLSIQLNPFSDLTLFSGEYTGIHPVQMIQNININMEPFIKMDIRILGFDIINEQLTLFLQLDDRLVSAMRNGINQECQNFEQKHGVILGTTKTVSEFNLVDCLNVLLTFPIVIEFNHTFIIGVLMHQESNNCHNLHKLYVITNNLLKFVPSNDTKSLREVVKSQVPLTSQPNLISLHLNDGNGEACQGNEQINLQQLAASLLQFQNATAASMENLHKVFQNLLLSLNLPNHPPIQNPHPFQTSHHPHQPNHSQNRTQPPHHLPNQNHHPFKQPHHLQPPSHHLQPPSHHLPPPSHHPQPPSHHLPQPHHHLPLPPHHLPNQQTLNPPMGPHHQPKQNHHPPHHHHDPHHQPNQGHKEVHQYPNDEATKQQLIVDQQKRKQQQSLSQRQATEDQFPVRFTTAQQMGTVRKSTILVNKDIEPFTSGPTIPPFNTTSVNTYFDNFTNMETSTPLLPTARSIPTTSVTTTSTSQVQQQHHLRFLPPNVKHCNPAFDKIQNDDPAIISVPSTMVASSTIPPQPTIPPATAAPVISPSPSSIAITSAPPTPAAPPPASSRNLPATTSASTSAPPPASNSFPTPQTPVSTTSPTIPQLIHLPTAESLSLQRTNIPSVNPLNPLDPFLIPSTSVLEDIPFPEYIRLPAIEDSDISFDTTFRAGSNTIQDIHDNLQDTSIVHTTTTSTTTTTVVTDQVPSLNPTQSISSQTHDTTDHQQPNTLSQSSMASSTPSINDDDYNQLVTGTLSSNSNDPDYQPGSSVSDSPETTISSSSDYRDMNQQSNTVPDGDNW